MASLDSGDVAVRWTSSKSNTSSHLFSVTYGNGTYVAVGENGTILTSNDGGDNWTNRASNTGKMLRSVAYGNGTYVAVGDDGTILSSGDGASWTTTRRATSLHFTVSPTATGGLWQ